MFNLVAYVKSAMESPPDQPAYDQNSSRPWSEITSQVGKWLGLGTKPPQAPQPPSTTPPSPVAPTPSAPAPLPTAARPAPDKGAPWAEATAQTVGEMPLAHRRQNEMREFIRGYTGKPDEYGPALLQSKPGQFYSSAYRSSQEVPEGADITANQVLERYVGDRVSGAMAAGDVGDLADSITDVLKLGQQGFDPRFVSRTLRDITANIDTSSWTPEQWKSWNERIAGQLATPTQAKLLQLTGSSATEAVQGAVAQQATKVVDEAEAAANRYIQNNPKGTGFTDWMTSNWQNFLIPAGALMMLFGGSTGKVLGLLALGGGAYNLYNRYNNMVKNPDVQDAILDSMSYANPDGTPNPFGNVDQIEDPAAQQGVRDYAFLLRSGFKDILMSKLHTQAQKFTESLFGPGAGGEVFEQHRQKAGYKEPSEVYKSVAENVWGGIKDSATSLFDKAKEGLQNFAGTGA